ncbi:MAG: hypothetical protein HLUCCX21_05775 [Porphyrobacter sp. HL-46]|nr:MAG: hypothetical protein HLUCCX21_05775 [Porphyrobacter sp. HL-46]
MGTMGSEAGLPRDLGEHAHWEVTARQCGDTGATLLCACLEDPAYSGSGRVFEAALPAGVALAELDARTALAIIAAADRVRIGGSHFGHAPRWTETDVHRVILAPALR